MRLVLELLMMGLTVSVTQHPWSCETSSHSRYTPSPISLADNMTRSNAQGCSFRINSCLTMLDSADKLARHHNSIFANISLQFSMIFFQGALPALLQSVAARQVLLWIVIHQRGRLGYRAATSSWHAGLVASHVSM